MTTLAGKVLDDAGLPIQGASVTAKDTLDGSTKGSTTTNEDGVWFFDEIDPLPDGIDYYVEVTWNGKTKVVYGLSAIQLANLTIGRNGMVVDPNGNVTLRMPLDPANAGKVNSPTLSLTGGYDSDATAGVTRTDRTMSLQLEVDVTTGQDRLLIKKTDGTTVAKIDSNGDFFKGTTKVSLEGHTHAGTAAATSLVSPNGTKSATVDDNGFLKLPGGIGGIKKIKWLTVAGTGTYAHGLGEAPQVCLPVARGSSAYFSVGINNADATNVYIHASTNSEMRVLLMVIN